MKTERRILAAAAIVLCVGTAIAYYNTSSLGYGDENILYISNEEIKVFDIDIKYSDIEEIKDKILNFLPNDYITI